MGALWPLFLSAFDFSASTHLQVSPVYSTTMSWMCLTGTMYDEIKGTKLRWIVEPSLYFSPDTPVSSAISAGAQFPILGTKIGYHFFGHFHSFDGISVQQYGHTLEFLHRLWEVKAHYYYPGEAPDFFWGKIVSGVQIDGEFTAHLQQTSLTVGPILDVRKMEWGSLFRISYHLPDIDVGAEVRKYPDYRVDPFISFFVSFKFPIKDGGNGSSSHHFKSIEIHGPTCSSTTQAAEIIKTDEL